MTRRPIRVPLADMMAVYAAVDSALQGMYYDDPKFRTLNRARAVLATYFGFDSVEVEMTRDQKDAEFARYLATTERDHARRGGDTINPAEVTE